MATFLPGPAGPLESLYRPPEGERPRGVPAAAVVCHPHPARGGTMHNKVVARVARGLGAAGLAVLRFNYRGVGMSAGRYDEGPGEREDIRAALDWLGARHDGPLLLAGFSFGARHGLEVGLAHPRVERLIAVGLPVRALHAQVLVGGGKPTLFLHGERDELGPADEVVALAQGWNAPAEVVILRGVGHFFERRLGDVQSVVLDTMSRAPATGVRTL